ncbi:hypothetical protein WA538_002138, partial [Blastocystis sp. DL]
DVHSSWTLRNEEHIASVVTLNEPKTNGADVFLALEKEQSTEPCELSIDLHYANELTGIQWIGSARICEVYIQEHSRPKPMYVGTVRCSQMEQTLSFQGNAFPMYFGQAVLQQKAVVDSVKIRFLSLKGKPVALLCALCIVGQETKLSNAPEQQNEPAVSENPTSLEDLQKMSSKISGELSRNLLFKSELRQLTASIQSYLDTTVRTVVTPLIESNQQLTKRVEELEKKVCEL